MERGIVLKADDERRFLLTVAYPVYKSDTAIAADGRIDVAGEKAVENACWRFLRKGAKTGMYHQTGFGHQAEVVENYIYRGPTWIIKTPKGTSEKIEPGDWLVGMILTPEAWSLYKAGIIGGVSVQGSAKRAAPSQETLAAVRRRANG